MTATNIGSPRGRAKAGEFTGWHMLAVVLAFFGVVIAVNIALAIAATGTFPGLVVENSYVASQRYDELLANARAQDEKGWRHQLEVTDGLLRFSLSQGDSRPLTGLSVIAHVGRPSTAQEDRVFDLLPMGNGSYVTSDPLAAGVWEVDLKAVQGPEAVFRRTQEIFVKPSEPKP